MQHQFEDEGIEPIRTISSDISAGGSAARMGAWTSELRYEDIPATTLNVGRNQLLSNLLTGLAKIACRMPKRIIGGAALFLVVAAVYAAPVVTELPSGGYEVPASESVRAEKILDEKFQAGGLPIVFAVTTSDGLDSAHAKSRAAEIVSALRASPYARQIASYWTAQPPFKNALAGQDLRTGLVVARIEGGDRDAPIRAHEIAEPLLGSRDGVTVTVGGQSIAYLEGSEQSRKDLITLEAIAVPLTAVALVWIFGSLVAATLPLLVAAIGIAGTGACLWTIYRFTDVSIFAVNLGTALGLALSVDYTLFILNRYREERANGADDRFALIRTMNTAGRTVIYSGLTMAGTMAALFVFTPYLLRSLAYAGLAAVGFATIATLCFAPALIVLYGDRIDSLDIRPPLRRLFGRSPNVQKPEEASFWYRSATWVMRRPVLVLVVLAAVLLALATPVLGLKLAYPDDRVLPPSTWSRQTGDILRAEFVTNFAATVSIVMPEGVPSREVVDKYASELSKVDDVVSVASPGGTYVHGTRVSPVAADSGLTDSAAYVTVSTTRDPYSSEGKSQLAQLRAVTPPASALFGGIAQRDNDNVRGIVDRAPLVIALVALTTLVLMFIMTGSVVLPIKALVTNALSLTVGFGVMVWVFQDGHLGGLGTMATGRITAYIPPFLAIIAYALSMDYEIFVLSRIREEWLRSGQTAADNERSVALGLARTGRIITAAAIVMAIVFVAIAAGEVAFMRGLGVGLIVSVLVDAFIVRTLLVPAAMGVMGRWNWWAPGPLARWHDKHGFVDFE